MCIVVLGKHVSQLKFLDVLLGDQPALPPGVSFYQRILAGDRMEAMSVAKALATEKGADHVPDDVLVPALRMARRDRRDDALSAEGESSVLEVTEAYVKASASTVTDATGSAALPLILGCPAHHRGEEITLQMLAQVLGPTQCRVEVTSTRLLPAEIEARVMRDSPAIVFIAVLPPGGIVQARYLCRRLRKRFPDCRIVVGYWGHVRNFDRFLVRFRSAGASYVVTSLLQSRSQIAALLANPTAGAVRADHEHLATAPSAVALSLPTP